MQVVTKKNDYESFKLLLSNSTNIVVLTGRDLSEESGVISFSKGPIGYWKGHRTTHLSSSSSFRSNPGLVWEYFNDRRVFAFGAHPNKAHIALAKFEEDWQADPEKYFHIITQNVDGLHTRAGNKNVIELHGSLSEVRCMNPTCAAIEINNTNPICEAFRDMGDSSLSTPSSHIPISELPKCKKCRTLVRPNIVWFGESLNKEKLEKSNELLKACDLCLVIGTSMVVYPAAEFAPMVANAGKAVAEFNINDEPSKPNFLHHFQGPASVTVPKALGYDNL